MESLKRGIGVTTFKLEDGALEKTHQHYSPQQALQAGLTREQIESVLNGYPITVTALPPEQLQQFQPMTPDEIWGEQSAGNQ